MLELSLQTSFTTLCSRGTSSVATLLAENKGSIFTGPDKFGTGPRLGADRPCVHKGPPGTGTMWVHLSGTMWVHLRKGPSTDMDRSRSRVNGQDRSHYGSVSPSILSNQNVHAVAAFYSSLISA